MHLNALPNEGERGVANDEVTTALRPVEPRPLVLSPGVLRRVLNLDDAAVAGPDDLGFRPSSQVARSSNDVSVVRDGPLSHQCELLSVHNRVDLTSQLSNEVLVGTLDLP